MLFVQSFELHRIIIHLSSAVMEREYDKEILELVSKPIKSDLNCLISISGHKLLRADIVIFKVVLRKWFNRFHTSQISRRLSLVSVLSGNCLVCFVGTSDW